MANDDPLAVTVSPGLTIRADGYFACITLKQGDVEIKLTPEQARSVFFAMKTYLPEPRW